MVRGKVLSHSGSVATITRPGVTREAAVFGAIRRAMYAIMRTLALFCALVATLGARPDLKPSWQSPSWGTLMARKALENKHPKRQADLGRGVAVRGGHGLAPSKMSTSAAPKLESDSTIAFAFCI